MTEAGWRRSGHLGVGADRLAYATVGEGPPVVLLHKLGGWIQEWTPLAGRLAGSFQLIAFDLPGHGCSMRGAAPAVQTPEDTARQAAAGLRELGVGPVSLIGASLGGAVAVVLAADGLVEARSLVLINAALTPARSQEEVDEQDRRTAASLWGPDDQPLERTFAETEKAFGLTDPAVRRAMTQSRAVAGAWVRPSWRGVAQCEVAGRLRGIEVPTLVVSGARAPALAASEAAAAGLPQANLAVIADAGSFPHEENPAGLTDALQAWGRLAG